MGPEEIGWSLSSEFDCLMLIILLAYMNKVMNIRGPQNAGNI
jgi:hypothetical protein